MTRKITRGLARINLGLQDCLFLGNLDALRDWGHARDYVEMQWRMLQQEKPEDFVIATGVQFTVRQFIEFAASELGASIEFEHGGVEEIGRIARVGDAASWKVGDVIVRVDPRYFRPAEVDALLGDATKAREKLGWTPTTALPALVREMVSADYEAARRDTLVRSAGFEAYGGKE